MKPGCYGLAWNGIDGAARYLAEVDDEARDIVVLRRELRDAEEREEILEAGYARLPLSDGSSVAAVDLAAGTVELALRSDYTDDAVLHPFIAGPAAVLNHWAGRDSFHAGAVVIGGKAWIVVGDKGDGKSTTLAYLASRGLPVLADDLIIEDAGEVFAGPGFVDLRPDAAHALGLGQDIGWLGARPRSRYDLPPRPSRVPVGGWIALAWGEKTALEPVPTTEQLELLFDSRTVWETPPDPASYLRHAARPAFRLVRPREWSSLERVYEVLVSSLA